MTTLMWQRDTAQRSERPQRLRILDAPAWRDAQACGAAAACWCGAPDEHEECARRGAETTQRRMPNTVVARAQRHKYTRTRRQRLTCQSASHERHPPPAPPSPLPPQTIVTTPTDLVHILASAMRVPPSTLFTSFCRQPSNGMLGTLYTHAYTRAALTPLDSSVSSSERGEASSASLR